VKSGVWWFFHVFPAPFFDSPKQYHQPKYCWIFCTTLHMKIWQYLSASAKHDQLDRQDLTKCSSSRLHLAILGSKNWIWYIKYL
jgi:hypothetical protein